MSTKRSGNRVFLEKNRTEEELFVKDSGEDTLRDSMENLQLNEIPGFHVDAEDCFQKQFFKDKNSEKTERQGNDFVLKRSLFDLYNKNQCSYNLKKKFNIERTSFKF